jgi:DNA mismatch repair ATPase MutL
MEDLSLHILDVVENSIAAQAKRVEIRVHEDEGARPSLH